MTLIKSISGIRGTIGGKEGDNLTPKDAVSFAAAFGWWLIETKATKKVVVGRDARISGEMLEAIVVNTLIGLGIDVLQLGLSTTPTVEMAVPYHQAGGGIILTASHNPIEWNALKLLNYKGEFISAEAGKRVLEIAESNAAEFASVMHLGNVTKDEHALQRHIDAILALPLVNKPSIESKKFRVTVDAVNSSGAFAVPALLQALGVKQIDSINDVANGHFAHNPEPLAENLTEISAKIKSDRADLGIVVDPDVDRLALVCENGEMFGEEYTLVAVADYVLSKTGGNTVSNLSSTRALKDVTESYGGSYSASAVGEVNVVIKMKQTDAIIGGEGNGGIIYPALHYGRDSLVGIALFLSLLAEKSVSLSQLKASYPLYHIVKNKIVLNDGINMNNLLDKLADKYQGFEQNKEDGLRIDIGQTWVHIRKSNTEPIMRIIAEANTPTEAENLANKFICDIKSLI